MSRFYNFVFLPVKVVELLYFLRYLSAGKITFQSIELGYERLSFPAKELFNVEIEDGRNRTEILQVLLHIFSA